MKKLLLLLTAVLALSPLRASEGEWITDLDAALKKAKLEKKLVLMDFTGSDWCPPCKKLHRTVLTADVFTKFAKDHLVLVEVDFPRSKPQSDALKASNQALQTKFGITGFPTVIVLDADGKELSKEVGFNDASADDYVKNLKKLKH